MRRWSSLVPVLALGLVAPTLTSAQEARTALPKVLMVEREEIKPGKSAAHEKVAAGFVSVLSKTKSSDYWMGLVPVSGDENVALFVGGHDSFAEVESARHAVDAALAANPALRAGAEALERQGGDVHASQRTMFARYREDLSYRSPTLADFAKSRFVTVVTVRVKPGHITDYEGYVKAYNEGRTKASVDVRAAFYQVTTGASAGTFLVFVPWASMAALDVDSSKALDAALGEDALKKLRQTAADTIADSQSALFALNPRISRVTPGFAAHDPEFWAPKPKPAAAAPSKKEAPPKP
jgi:hypothetical protein